MGIESLYLDTIGLSVVVQTLVVVAIVYHFRAFSFWRKRGINGPTPLPFLGNDLSYMLRHKIDAEAGWFKKHGKVYGIYQGYDPVLRIADANLIKHILIKDFSNFADRNGKQIYGPHMKRWLFFSRVDRWIASRALMTPMFTGSKMRTMFGMMKDCVRRFTDEIESRLRSSNNNKDKSTKTTGKGTAADLSRDEFLSLNLDILAMSLFGLKLDTYREKTSEFYKRAFAFAKFDVGWFIIWTMIPGFIARWLKLDLIRYHKYEYFDKLSQKILDERRRSPDTKKNDFIQVLLNADIPASGMTLFNEEDDALSHYNAKADHQELSESGSRVATNDSKLRKMEDIDIRAQMSFLFLAGFEATSTSLTYCFYQMAHQPHLQEELYEELREAMDKKADGEDYDYNDVMELKKLDAFVSETLRMYPTVTDNTRVVTAKEGATLPTSPPVHLPFGTTIAISVYKVHHDPDYWPNPEEFDMSRFYPENRDKLKSGTFLPFGLGPRNCAGMRFALVAIKTTLAKTLLRYKVFKSHDTQAYPARKFRQHAFFLHLVQTGFTLKPRQI